MREAVIIATARTPIGKAYRGAFNNTQAQALAAHAITHALERSRIAGDEVDDVILGCALQQGCTSSNIARQAALRAGLPTSVAGMTVDRQCASGLMATAIAAKQIIVDGQQIVIGGGVESISLVQNEHLDLYRAQDPWLVERRPDLYMSMLETAEIVAQPSHARDESGLESALSSLQRRDRDRRLSASAL
jgi:acetyl-CoA C-acetyltransferase